MKKLLALVLVLALCALAAVPALAGFAPVPQDEIKIGFIYIGDPSDKGYTYAHHQGTVYMQEELGLRDDQIIIKSNVYDGDACRTAILECIEQGAHIIFANSFGYMDYMEEMAEEYPNVIFSHCSGYKSNDVNFNNYFGRIYQSRFLTGLAAGLRTESNKIGFVAAHPIPEVIGGANAFALGVMAVNPEATVTLKYTNTWYDPTVERQAAEALLDAGCDVIAQHQDTSMPQKAAEDRFVWSVGYNADMTEEAPDAHLTAPIWFWGVYVKYAVEQVIEGTWTPENSFMGMAEGLVGISPLSKNVVDGTAEIIEEYRAMIMSGEFDVFDANGVFADGIFDNEGNPQIAPGARYDVPEITSIMWYLNSITVDN
ncbi:MAG: BMP family ABC transporter substrate-binding protein [Clostridia bacterium]|nr:BMP family ABC transporter substrate-binding protein [Clostridia bacterium]